MTIARQVGLARTAQNLLIYTEITREFMAVGSQDQVGGVRHYLRLADPPALVIVLFRHGYSQGGRVDDRSRPKCVYSDSLRP